MERMKSKSLTLGALAGGFILGSRAGSGPYQRVKSTMFKVRQDPRVQEAAQTVEDAAKAKAQATGETLKQAAHGTAERTSVARLLASRNRFGTRDRVEHGAREWRAGIGLSISWVRTVYAAMESCRRQATSKPAGPTVDVVPGTHRDESGCGPSGTFPSLSRTYVSRMRTSPDEFSSGLRVRGSAPARRNSRGSANGYARMTRRERAGSPR